MRDRPRRENDVFHSRRAAGATWRRKRHKTNTFSEGYARGLLLVRHHGSEYIDSRVSNLVGKFTVVILPITLSLLFAVIQQHVYSACSFSAHWR